MHFRIVGPNQHRAVVGPSTFLCVRRDTRIENGIALVWIASRNDVVLKDDCRTLNEAKNLCRQVSAEESLVLGSAGVEGRKNRAAVVAPLQAPAR